MSGWDWAAVTAVITGIAVAVTLVLFIIESRSRATRDREAAVHAAISRVLTAMESSVRRQQRPLLLRMWSKSELDYALAIPRLRHDLADEDEVVVAWALRQTQDMMAADSDKESREVGVRLSTKLVEWGHGKLGREWFAAQLAERPIQEPFNIPLRNRVRRGLSRAPESFISGIAIAAGLVAFSRLRIELRNIWAG